MFTPARLAKMAIFSVVALFMFDTASAFFFDKGHEPMHIVKKVPYPVEHVVPIKIPMPYPVYQPPKTIIKKIHIRVNF